jgi:surfactin synthase thioesterase subunit
MLVAGNGKVVTQGQARWRPHKSHNFTHRLIYASHFYYRKLQQQQRFHNRAFLQQAVKPDDIKLVEALLPLDVESRYMLNVICFIPGDW